MSETEFKLNHPSPPIFRLLLAVELNLHLLPKQMLRRKVENKLREGIDPAFFIFTLT
jgi:hypothetical protein